MSRCSGLVFGGTCASKVTSFFWYGGSVAAFGELKNWHIISNRKIQ